MTRMFFRLLVAVWLILIGAPILHAQQTAAEISESTEDDKGFITRFLQEKLSGAGRTVTIDGFEGALSSRATFTKMTISDDKGPWITLEDGAIQWTRSALIRRRVSIQELTAGKIILARLPGTGESKPTAETRDFSLPELPVGVNIDHIAVGRVELGESIIGQALTLAVDGSLNLSDGEGTAKLKIDRVDGPRGQFLLDTSFSNSTRILNLNLDLDEDANGLFVNIVKLEGRPSVKAEIKGAGPLNQFEASLRLATNGQDRVTGNLAFHPETQGTDAGTGFKLQMQGDISALVPEQHKDFFGTNSTVVAEGWRGETGELRIPTISVATNAINLAGGLTTTDKGAPQSAQFELKLGADANAPKLPVLLPWADKPTTVESGRITLNYDAAKNSYWAVRGKVGKVMRAEGKLDELRLDGNGTVDLTNGALQSVNGWFAFGIDGVLPTDPKVADAVGDNLNGGFSFDMRPGNALEFTNLNINGPYYRLTGAAIADGLASGITLSGDLTATYRDLAHLSGVAGRKLSGSTQSHVRGYYTVITHAFDAEARVTGTNITVDQEHADRLLAGRSDITISARRDETGIELRDLQVNAQNLTVRAQGFLNSQSADVNASISMPSLTVADPNMAGSVKVGAHVTGADGQRVITVTGKATDLVTGVKDVDGALKGDTDLRIVAGQKDGGFALEEFKLMNPQLGVTGGGDFAAGAMNAKIDLNVPNLAVFDRGVTGALTATATATEQGGIRSINIDGTGENLAFGGASGEGTLTGTTKLKVLAEQQGQSIAIKVFDLANAQMNATAEGSISPEKTNMVGNVDVKSLAFLGQGWRGSVQAKGSFTDDGSGGRLLDVTGTGHDLSFGQAQVDGALAGRTDLTLRGTERGGVFAIDTAKVSNPRLNVVANGSVGKGATDVTATVNAADLRFLGRGIRGAVEATGHLVDRGGNRQITAKGSASGLGIGNEKADALLRGQTTIDLAATMDPQNRLSVQRLIAQNPQLQIEANGDPSQRVNVNARLANLEILAPGFAGAAEVTGTIAETPQTFNVDLRATAPGNIDGRVQGTIARNFATMNLNINGTADVAVANPTLKTRSIEGPVSYDLKLNGKPSLDALSGVVRIEGARLADPKLGLSVSALNVTATIANSRLQVEGRGGVEPHGTVIVTGPVTLTGERPLDLNVDLQGVVLRDPNLYETKVDGTLRVNGALGTGPMIAGRLRLSDTELRIASTGFGGAASIPAIKHLYDRPPVRATRAKAGLSGYPGPDAAAAGMAGPAATAGGNPAKFDITVSAPNQVFVRGRGVDAELGGEVRLTGTSAQPIPVGQFELIRGRVDLLGKRFDLTEGIIELQGSLIPFIRLVAETLQDGITTRIIIDGDAKDPDIKFESSPDMPEEEVLSHLLFGRGLDKISALQAAQLANAIAVLAGRGGEGIVGRLRQATGLDDLDLTTDDEGQVSVRAGKYLSKNLYTDVQVGADGETRLNLNLDISRSVTARGSVDSAGDSTIGVFYDRDY